MKPLHTDTPPSALRATSSAGEEENRSFVRTHQYRSKRMRNIARNLRKTQTPHEEKLWQHLRRRQLGVQFRRQYLIDNKYVVDFVCLEKKLIIEIDGSQHAENTNDLQRTAYLEKQGFKILRFWNITIVQQFEACLEIIRQACM